MLGRTRDTVELHEIVPAVAETRLPEPRVGLLVLCVGLAWVILRVLVLSLSLSLSLPLSLALALALTSLALASARLSGRVDGGEREKDDREEFHGLLWEDDSRNPDTVLTPRKVRSLPPYVSVLILAGKIALRASYPPTS
jgi:hypothetical protein